MVHVIKVLYIALFISSFVGLHVLWLISLILNIEMVRRRFLKFW